MKILRGDSLHKLKELEANSIDSVVTDPPYGLSFMGKAWDYDVPKVELWREVLRVLKPGGHLLSFGGTRTYHRMAVEIEDAGFEIRDQLQWIYGSGFPKSHAVSKGIDKAAGAERQVIGDNPNHRLGQSQGKDPGVAMLGQPHTGSGKITASATDAAKLWDGWGTALKPANEPIVLARKPLSEKTVAANVLRWGTGAINVDASRIGAETIKTQAKAKGSSFTSVGNANGFNGCAASFHQGRWPANVLFDESAAEMLNAQSGRVRFRTIETQSGDYSFSPGHTKGHRKQSHVKGGDAYGGASRFFYVAKASKAERNKGLEGMPLREPPGSKRSAPAEGRQSALGEPRQNFHPTVKPVRLMQYLIKLITPPNGTVLDPFMGSGSTGVAATALGFKFVGVELSEEYYEIAKKRIEASA